jgi:hypothetical protein
MSDPRFAHRPLNGCSGCREDFASVSAFDRHRVGTFEPNDRRCMDDREMLAAGMEVDERGRWRIALTDADRERLQALKGVAREARRGRRGGRGRVNCPVCLRPLAEHSKHDRYNHSEKGRARWRRYYDRRWDDSDPVKRGLFRGSEGLRKRGYQALQRRAARHEGMESERQRWRDEDEARA